MVLLSERSVLMVVDSHTLSPSPKRERSPQKASQKRRLQPSKYPVITDFFDRQSRVSKKTSRRRRTTGGGEKGKRPKRTPRRIVAGGNAHRCFALHFFLIFIPHQIRCLRNGKNPRVIDGVTGLWTSLYSQPQAGGSFPGGRGEMRSPLTQKMSPSTERWSP